MKIKLLAIPITMLSIALTHSAAHADDVRTTRPHAFYVAEFIPRDAAALRPYSDSVESTFAPFSGRYVVRGGSVLPLEGSSPKGRMVVIEFDSLEQAKAWYDSAAYAAIRPIRHRAGETNAYFMEASVAAPTEP